MWFYSLQTFFSIKLYLLHHQKILADVKLVEGMSVREQFTKFRKC